jgi:hypothetical protein
MTFDSTKPDGGAPIAQGDNDIRDNQDAVLAALGAEHIFVDADPAQQTGRHAFPVGTDIELANDPPSTIGALAFSSTQRPGYLTLMTWDGAAWVSPDVNPAVASVVTLPRLDENLNWTASQRATWELETIDAGAGPGGVNLLTMDFAASPYKKALIDGDTFIANPTNLPTLGDGVTVYLDIVMDGAGLHTITFDTFYRAQGGLVQISTIADSKTMLSFLLLGADPVNEEILVTSIPNYDVSGVTASSQIL